MRFSSVLIITYGRSGSTLLQGLLNSIEGCLVRGENYNFCYGLYRSYRSLRATHHRYGGRNRSSSPAHPWFGAELLSETRFLDDARRLVENQLRPGRNG